MTLTFAEGWHPIQPPPYDQWDKTIKDYDVVEEDRRNQNKWYAFVLDGRIVAVEPVRDGKMPLDTEVYVRRFSQSWAAKFERRWLRECELIWGCKIQDLLKPNEWESLLDLE